jgi:hypothetical protein
MTTETIASTGMPGPIHKILGEPYGFWCQTVVLLIAAAIAWIAIRTSRSLERKKAAAQVIFSSRQDEQLTSAVHTISLLHESDRNMATYAKKENQGTDQSKAIQYALNHYEYVSVGISQEIYDEQIFKHSSYTTVTNLYNRTRTYVDAVRKEIGSNTTWQEFQCLACRWLNDPLEQKVVRSMPEKKRFRKWLAKKIEGRP